MLNSIKNLKIKISISFIVLITLILLTGLNEIAISACFASIIHEIGHLIAIIVLGGRVEGINLKAFAAEILIVERTFSFKGEAIISLCGPLINIFTGVVSMLLCGLNNFGICSLILGLFHLLPVLGLDGGNAVNAFISENDDRELLHKIILITSAIFSVILFVLGIFVLIITKFNISCIIMALIIIFETVRQKDSGFLKFEKSA